MAFLAVPHDLAEGSSTSILNKQMPYNQQLALAQRP